LSQTQKNPFCGPYPVKYVTRLSAPQFGHAWRNITSPGPFWAVFAFFSAMMRYLLVRGCQIGSASSAEGDALHSRVTVRRGCAAGRKVPIVHF
jgi:hypothetical protein